MATSHGKIRNLLTALCTVSALAAPASADIKAYNAAVLKGDFAAAASEAAVTWPALDKSRPDIFVVGREFAWTSMLANKPQIARDIISSLSDSRVPDPAPKLTSVLLAWADFSAKPGNTTRKALANALAERAQTPTAELISLRAAQELFTHEWARDNFDGAASVISALISEIDASLTQETDVKLRSALIAQLATTIAWRGVERNVLEFSGVNPTGAGGTENEGETKRMREKWFPIAGDPSIPPCDLTLDTAGVRPKYPKLALTKRLPGYAIYAFDIAEDGQFKSARVLGSAPHDMFTETIDEILPAWKWKMSDRNSSNNCRTPEVLIVDFVFEVRRR
jgi:hypothetical protein